MNFKDLPLNVWVMDTSPENMKRVATVSSMDTFDSGGHAGNFHPHGLFSTEIFGRVGSPLRLINFGKIELKATILKPFIFNNICKLKRLYKEILTGKGFAVWNKTDKDFESSNIGEGETGYQFFMSHLHEIQFKETESDERAEIIKMLYKHIKDGKAFTNAMLVIPAALRDVFIEQDGRVNEDEINSRYRALIASANAMPENADFESPIFNNTRVSIQNAANAIFEYLWNILDGKNGFIYKKYYSRGLENGTRNVLSAMDTRVNQLGQLNAPKMNSTVCGLFQTMKGLLPVAQNLILNGWLKEVFNTTDGRAMLTNAQTLKMEEVNVDRKWYDSLHTPAGIAKNINAFFERKRRFKPVMFNDSHYIGLVYRGKVNGRQVFKFFHGIDELPPHLSRKDVYPITWIELFYIAGYRQWNTFPVMFTRYPVAGMGSTFVSYYYVKTTTSGQPKYELDDNWEIKEFVDANPIKYAYEYPDMKNHNCMETMAPHPSRLGAAGADFDGDTGSGNGIYTEEAVAEISEYLNSARAYLNPKGGFINSPMVETVELVLIGLMA